VRLAAIQHDIEWESPAANLARLSSLVDAAADEGAQMVVLTEMFSTGFSMAPERTAEAHDGPSVAFLVDRAAATGAWVAASIPLNMPGVDRPQNVLTLAGPGGELHRYAKIHPFSYSGEDNHSRAGESFLTVEVHGVRCTFFVCYDLRFADEFWATAATTDCYIVPANWPAARRAHWMTLLCARSIENQAYVVGVNRVGEGDGLAYAGDSRIFTPLGEVLASAEDREVSLFADIDPAVVADTRARFPFMADRRAH
jgi:predicted amidohydrolase